MHHDEPFDDPDGTFLVLVNDEGQPTPWRPAFRRRARYRAGDRLDRAGTDVPPAAP